MRGDYAFEHVYTVIAVLRADCASFWLWLLREEIQIFVWLDDRFRVSHLSGHQNVIDKFVARFGNLNNNNFVPFSMF